MAINYRKNKSTRLSSGGKYYAEVDRQKTLSTRGLAEHLKDHNCMVGRDAIAAVLVKLSECIPELVAQGIGVKLDGLGIFYPSVLNEKGGATEEQMQDKTFNPTSIIKGIRLRFTPDSSELDNLTSKAFLRNNVSPASQNIIDVESRTVNGKPMKVQTLVTLEDYRNPDGSGSSGSTDSGNGGSTGDGGGTGTGGNPSTGGSGQDDGGNSSGGGNNTGGGGFDSGD